MFLKLSLMVYFRHYQVKGGWSFLGDKSLMKHLKSFHVALLIMEIHYSINFPTISFHTQNLRAEIRE